MPLSNEASALSNLRMKEALSRFKDTVKTEIRKALKVLRNDEDMEEVDSSKKDLANQEKMLGWQSSFKPWKINIKNLQNHQGLASREYRLTPLDGDVSKITD